MCPATPFLLTKNIYGNQSSYVQCLMETNHHMSSAFSGYICTKMTFKILVACQPHQSQFVSLQASSRCSILSLTNGSIDSLPFSSRDFMAGLDTNTRLSADAGFEASHRASPRTAPILAPVIAHLFLQIPYKYSTSSPSIAIGPV